MEEEIAGGGYHTKTVWIVGPTESGPDLVYRLKYQANQTKNRAFQEMKFGCQADVSAFHSSKRWRSVIWRRMGWKTRKPVALWKVDQPQLLGSLDSVVWKSKDTILAQLRQDQIGCEIEQNGW